MKASLFIQWSEFQNSHIWFRWLCCAMRLFVDVFQHEQISTFSCFDFCDWNWWIHFILCSNAQFSIILRPDMYNVQRTNIQCAGLLLWHKITSDIAHSGKGNPKRGKKKDMANTLTQTGGLEGRMCLFKWTEGLLNKEEKEELLLHFLSLYRLPQLGHGSTAVFLQKATSVEAREHGDEEGRRVEEEEAREEGAQPGECEEASADQGEVEHGRGGLHGQGQWWWKRGL